MAPPRGDEHMVDDAGRLYRRSPVTGAWEPVDGRPGTFRSSSNSSSPRGTPNTAPPGPRGWRGVPSGPSPRRTPARASAPNYLGRIFGALAGIVGLLLAIGVFAQANNGPSGEGSSATPGSTSPAFVPADPAAAYAELRRQVVADDSEVRSSIAEMWVPQLASARKGLVVDGVVFDYTDILKEHRALRQQYTQARLVWSGDWSVFKGRDFFVTVLAVPFGTAEGANRWCSQQGIDRDHCFAKLLSQVRGPEGATGHR